MEALKLLVMAIDKNSRQILNFILESLLPLHNVSVYCQSSVQKCGQF